MKRLIALAALLMSAAFAADTIRVTPPTKVEHVKGSTEYSYNLTGTPSSLVVVVPDTTVPIQRIVIQNKQAPAPTAKCPPIIVVPQTLIGSTLPSGVKSAKEAMAVWPFAALLEKANTALDVPETVKLGKSSEVKLVVDMAQAAEQLKGMAGTTATGEKIEITHIVVAKILAPDFTVIEAVNDGRQVLNPNGPTEWRWTVTPKKLGEYKINVTMSAVIEIGGDRAERLVKVFDQDVTVFVTPVDAVKYFFTKNWQWLWSTLIVPAALWFWRRKKAQVAAEVADEV